MCWFIGDFEPVALKTKDFEVGVGHHEKGEKWDKHFHKLATEITLILKGKVKIEGKNYTLLLAPMAGFYSDPDKGKTQMRVAVVEPMYLIEKMPQLLSELYKSYLQL